VGFEPTGRFQPSDFKSGAINHALPTRRNFELHLRTLTPILLPPGAAYWWNCLLSTTVVAVNLEEDTGFEPVARVSERRFSKPLD
jgi:hypothetical protein